METNLQYNRILFKNNKEIIKKLKVIYPDYRILIGNFSYILKHKQKTIIKLYYYGKFFHKELYYYNLFKKNNFIIPKIISTGKYILNNRVFHFIEFENVRVFHKKLYSYQAIGIKRLADFLSKLHTLEHNLNIGLTHGNLHPSNFFLKKKQLGFFDFLSIERKDINYDFSKILYHSNLNTDLIKKILKYYKYSNYISIKKILIYTFLHIKANLGYNNLSCISLTEEINKLSKIKSLIKSLN